MDWPFLPLSVISQTRLVTAHPPLIVCVTYFGVVDIIVTLTIMTHNSICGIKNFAIFWVSLGAASPIPFEVTSPMEHSLTDLPFIFIILIVPFLPYFTGVS